MAQSEVTVTPPSPTPPTNIGFVGSTPPNPFNYADEVYEDPVANPPPFFDAHDPGTSIEFNSAHPLLEEGGTSVDHEGRGTEVVEEATSTNPGPLGQLKTFSCLGDFTSSPNGDHASAMPPSVAPTITGLLPLAPTKNGTEVLTVNGTGFRGDSIVSLDGVPQNTVYVSATQLKVMNARKRTTNGNIAVTVVTGGEATAATNWVFA